MAITLEYVFTIHMMLGNRKKYGPVVDGGQRGFVTAAGGRIEGPRLNGHVVANSGGDWAHYRADGTVAFNASYMLEADDGTLIHMTNRGYRHAPAEIAQKMEALEPVPADSYYMRVNPAFECPTGPHDWLTRTVIVGEGDRHADHTEFKYYAVL